MKTTSCLSAFFALTLLHASAAPNPVESELFPPDFLFSQHEALGLNETQIQDMQATVRDAAPKFESMKSQLEERAKAFQDAIHQDKPDITQADDKLHSMLLQENEMKQLQMHVMLTLRSKLTPDQVAKARALRAQSTSGGSAPGASASSPSSSSANPDPTNGLRERLQAKFEQLKTAVQAEASATGQPPEDIVTKAHEIQQLVQTGKPEEAEKELDALLATLSATKAKP